ncbi:MAG TPA: hypothetical protein VFL73_00575 [Solirubrobacteraceae bacterium]|nr:hypothetical protein [Solirubrobacteraceae bacterium]
MTDLLDELRETNPVDREGLEVPPALAARVATPPHRPQRKNGRTVVMVAGLTIAVFVAIALSRGDSADRLSLAAKAYAKTAGPGVRHWRISLRTYINGRPRGIVQRQEGWARGGTLHILLFEAHHLSSDIRQTPSHSRSWGAGMNDYVDVPAPQHRQRGPLQLGDPFAEFRRAYDAGRLVRIDATTYRMRPDHRQFPAGSTLTYELQPTTALPAKMTLSYIREPHPFDVGHADGAHISTVFTFDSYERLPDTAANREKLKLLPHPGAGPSTTDARSVFSILRDGAQLTARQRKLVALFAKHALFGKPRFDVASARSGPHGIVLVAGKGYVGMMRNGGGTLATVDTAVRRGMAISGSSVNRNHSMYVIAPDGVRALRARLPHHLWQSFPVTQNVAVLPNGGYHFVFVR